MAARNLIWLYFWAVNFELSRWQRKSHVMPRTDYIACTLTCILALVFSVLARFSGMQRGVKRKDSKEEVRTESKHVSTPCHGKCQAPQP
jgi:hypothetical protein